MKGEDLERIAKKLREEKLSEEDIPTMDFKEAYKGLLQVLDENKEDEERFRTGEKYILKTY